MTNELIEMMNNGASLAELLAEADVSAEELEED